MSDQLQPNRKRATVITVGNPKGGVGKSTICICLAIEAMLRGKKVLILDSDDQATADKFVSKREKFIHELKQAGKSIPRNDFEHVIQRSNIPKFLRQNINRYDWIIVDTKGITSAEFIMASVWSDIIISPTTVSPADSDELVPLNNLMENINANRESIGLDPIKAHVLINKVESKTFNSLFIPCRRELIEKINNQDGYQYLEMMKSYLTSYTAYQVMHIHGKGVTEIQDKAKGQFQVFVNEIEQYEQDLEVFQEGEK
ncbi:ParA family protein [Photobacterium damselae]|uniref:ParA family protein n=1 Tax=Photobacterium damselae TaxID=38293 RepID=UPI0040689773